MTDHGCEAIEAMYVYANAQRCLRRATGTATCEEGHVHPVCPEHGGPPPACECEGGCQGDADPREPLCRSCRRDGCEPYIRPGDGVA